MEGMVAAPSHNHLFLQAAIPGALAMRRGMVLALGPTLPLPACGKSPCLWKQTLAIWFKNTQKHVVLWDICFQSFPTIIWDLFPFEFTELYQFTSFSKGLCYMQECGVERTWVFATGICFGSKRVGRRGNGQPTKGFGRIIPPFQQATARATHELGLSLLPVGVGTDKLLLPAV